MAMRWLDLAFLHWPVPAEALAQLIPAPLELDLFEGQAWLGVVPFRMAGIRPRGIPALPGSLSAFPEINLRTYVTHSGRPGVWFFSLDVTQPIAVWTARRFFHLPYFRARMRTAVLPGGEGRIGYQHARSHAGAGPASFVGSYAPIGPIRPARPGSLEHWLTERYCLYAADGSQRVFRGEIHHAPWPLQPAAVTVDEMTMFAQVGLPEPSAAPLAHFARQLDVIAWLPTPVDSAST